MKAFVIALAMLALASTSSDASKRQTPVPLPPPAPQSIWAPEVVSTFAQVNPDPFNTQRRPAPTSDTPTPQVSTAPAPVVVTSAPPAAPETTNDKIRAWLHTMFAGLLATVASWFGLKSANNVGKGGPALDPSKLQDVLGSVLSGSIIKDPELKAATDLALLKLIQSGVPGQALQTGLGLIPVPGIGAAAGALEPFLRRLVVDELQKRAGAVPSPAIPVDPAAVHAETDQRLAGIEGILKLLAGRLTDKPTAT